MASVVAAQGAGGKPPAKAQKAVPAKLLLMGKSGSGKTSMRSIIFANYLARDTMRLGPTLDVEHSNVRFLGNLVLNLWDCGGQDAFYTNYFKSQREHIFRNVELLIYVFDIESRNMESDFDYYKGCIDALVENSDDARVFVPRGLLRLLLHPATKPCGVSERPQKVIPLNFLLPLGC